MFEVGPVPRLPAELRINYSRRAACACSYSVYRWLLAALLKDCETCWLVLEFSRMAYSNRIVEEVDVVVFLFFYYRRDSLFIEAPLVEAALPSTCYSV